MVLNSDINVYGRESKPAKFSSKSKELKSFGLKFPFSTIGSGNFLKKASGVELVKSNLRQLLLTNRGERPMLPLFGTNLRLYLMEPLDQAVLSQIRKEILESIYNYAPNVSVQKILVVPISEGSLNGGSAIRIDLFCTLVEEDSVGFEVKIELS